MTGWRLCRAPYAGLSGEGARLHGGRWNRRGSAMVYLCSTAALTVLEVRVHLDLPPELLPDDYVLMAVALDGIGVETLQTIPDDPAGVGETWLAERRTALLEVPSSIVPESSNLLFNPFHPDAARARIISTRRFGFDLRLWGSCGDQPPGLTKTDTLSTPLDQRN